ncbi:MAG: single-stranded DNA-binding protein [bacterium]
MSDLKLVSINKVLLSGRLTRDPELRYAPSGSAVASFPIAMARNYKNQAGEWKQSVVFVNIVTWGRQAEIANGVLKKGSAVFVEGRLRSRTWQTEEGQRRSVLEVTAERVQFLDRIAKPEVEEEEFVESVGDEITLEGEEEVPF